MAKVVLESVRAGPTCRGAFPAGECLQPKIMARAEGGAAVWAQSWTEPFATPAPCQECSLVFLLCVPAGQEHGAGGGWVREEKGDRHHLSFIFPGEELCLQCPARGTQRAKHTSRGWALGCPGSAGMDVDKSLPAAPRPWAALNRHPEMLRPGQTRLTPQKYPQNGRHLGTSERCACRETQTAIPGLTSRSSHTPASEKNMNSQPLRPDSPLQ